MIMAVGVGGVMVVNPNSHMLELWENFSNLHPTLPWWPYMLITVSCGAISGFHATQSPLMARCLQDEEKGRRVFYGAMITEAMIVLWAETVYLLNNKKNYLITLFPAVFMTTVTSTYFLVSPECLGELGIPYNNCKSLVFPLLQKNIPL
ncbi:MAG: hypothetical protein J6M39_03095 [Lachnospiraceae bacterium]|nr:hypothetical protein [Lachnospiraceae bacterium]